MAILSLLFNQHIADSTSDADVVSVFHISKVGILQVCITARLVKVLMVELQVSASATCLMEMARELQKLVAQFALSADSQYRLNRN
jgi:hypothetical protein